MEENTSRFHRKQGSDIFNYPVDSIKNKNHLNGPTVKEQTGDCC